MQDLHYSHSNANISERQMLPPDVVVRLVVLQWQPTPQSDEILPYCALHHTHAMSMTQTKPEWQLPWGPLHAMHTLDYCAFERLRTITDQPILYWSQVATVGEYSYSKGGKSALSIEYIIWVSSQENTSVSPHNTISDSLDQPSCVWLPLEQLPALSTHDRQLIQYAQLHLAQRSLDIRVLAALIGQEFTLQQLYTVAQLLRHEHMDLANFRRTALASGQLEPTGETRKVGRHRPAAVYRLKPEQSSYSSDHRSMQKLLASLQRQYEANSQELADMGSSSNITSASRSALASLIPQWHQ